MDEKVNEDHSGQKEVFGHVLSTTGVLRKSKIQSPGLDMLGTGLDPSRRKAQTAGLDLRQAVLFLTYIFTIYQVLGL